MHSYVKNSISNPEHLCHIQLLLLAIVDFINELYFLKKIKNKTIQLICGFNLITTKIKTYEYQ